MPDTATRIPAVSVALHRAEGPSDSLGDATFTGPECWSHAASRLRSWATTAPAEYGTDAVDFTVTYADGETYSGCYGLTRHDTGNLGAHMRRHLAWAADPAHAQLVDCPTAEYQAFLDGRVIGY